MRSSMGSSPIASSVMSHPAMVPALSWSTVPLIMTTRCCISAFSGGPGESGAHSAAIRFTEVPIEGLVHRRGIALKAREPDVSMTRLESCHCRLRRPHPRSYFGLGKAEGDTPGHQCIAERPPAPAGHLVEAGEVPVVATIRRGAAIATLSSSRHLGARSALGRSVAHTAHSNPQIVSRM